MARHSVLQGAALLGTLPHGVDTDKLLQTAERLTLGIRHKKDVANSVDTDSPQVQLQLASRYLKLIQGSDMRNISDEQRKHLEAVQQFVNSGGATERS